MSKFNSDPGDIPEGNSKESYALSGKIMLTAIVVLFTVVVVMVGLHLYARWYVLRARRRQLRRHRRTHLVFYVDPTNPNATVTVPAATRGLDASVLKSLPVFVYSAETHPETVECAVCLSEFEENEKGRLLPKCNHSFHIDCIDMWFHSHSTCPLCRSPVEPSGSLLENPAEVVISVGESAEPEVGSSSSMCSTCQHEELEMNHGRSSSTASTSSFGARRKPSTIQVPRRNGSFGGSDDGLGTESPASQAFKSPGSRILSLKRILSRTLSPSSASCGTVIDSEFDVERGRDETSQPSRVQTPRS